MEVLSADEGDCWACCNVFICDVYVERPLIDGDRAVSDAFKDDVELPYNKLTKFKLCADKFDDSSLSFIRDDVCLIGDFDRFP